MKLIHYSHVATLKPASVRQSKLPKRKPAGLWISDDADYGWARWCDDNGYGHRDGSFEHVFRVVLEPKAKILRIKSRAQLLAFSHKYQGNTEMDKLMRETLGSLSWNKGKDREWIGSIDWLAVAKKYQGILITPFRSDCHLDNVNHWYCGWDCASGVIWDAKAIKNIKEVRHGTK